MKTGNTLPSKSYPLSDIFSSQEQIGAELKSLLSRLHVLIIGPGLGRESYMTSYAKLALSLARESSMYVVLDADALLIVGQDPSIIHGYSRAVVTPNIVEFKRLGEKLGIDPKSPPDQLAVLVSRALGGVTVLQKGAHDFVSVDNTQVEDQARQTKETIEVDTEGGMKRCGGQGDVLSGCVGAMLAWGKCYQDGAFGCVYETHVFEALEPCYRDRSIPASRIPLLGAIGGSIVTRTTSRRVYLKQGRGVVTQDMLSEIGASFAEVFGDEAQGQDKGKL